MPELPPVTPALIESIIKGLVDVIERHVEVALAPIETRVDELQRRIAELVAKAGHK